MALKTYQIAFPAGAVPQSSSLRPSCCAANGVAGDMSSVDIRIRPLFRVSHRRQAILRQPVGRARHLRRFFGLLDLIVI